MDESAQPAAYRVPIEDWIVERGHDREWMRDRPPWPRWFPGRPEAHRAAKEDGATMCLQCPHAVAPDDLAENGWEVLGVWSDASVSVMCRVCHAP